MGSGGQRDDVGLREAHRLLVDDRRGRARDRRLHDRRFAGDVQLEEVVPAVERVRIERVDVRAVGEREPLPVRAGELADELGAVPPGLLVLPLAGHEDGHVDLVDERDGVERIRDRGVVVGVRLDLRRQVGGLAVERLVGGARRVAALDPLVGVGLPAVRSGGLRLVLALLGPVDGEAGVEDAARVERRRRGVEDRERRDGRERRRLERSGEELADPAVGDAHHPDLVVLHPRLAGDRLDDVVAVEALQRLEEVEGAARATGAAHVDVDDREAHEVREDGDAALRSVRLGVPVARVLDQRRVRRRVRGAAGDGEARGKPGEARRARRQVHVDGELRPVAGREVPVAAAPRSTGRRRPGSTARPGSSAR